MFNRVSIRQKLTAMLMIVSSTMLLLASIAFVTWDFYRFRADMRSDMVTQAHLVLDNVAAAITFQDPDAAGETLEMLEIHPHTQLACIYLADGRLFAFRVFRDPSDQCPATPTPGVAMGPNRMVVTEQLTRGRDLGATLLIADDLDAHTARLRTQATAVAAILIAGWLVSFLLSSLLQRMVSRPIDKLAGTAESIATGGDFSIRAAASDTQDEIGLLVRAFNRMLDEIQKTQRDRMEALDREQQANRLKDEFLATLSHELRTPLNAIVGWVHLLRRNQLPAEEVQHALERIDRNAHAQARLVQDLLDVSRITSGKLILDVQEIDLEAVAINAIDACRPAADAREVTIECRSAGPLITMGDPDRLQQVMWNLISNAVRFTPAQGAVTVSLRRDGATDIIEVKDTGSGIEPQFLPHMFEAFRQADAASTRAHGGLGLGLTIVRRLTEMHGGSVGVASEGLGKGATLTVTLPVRRVTGPNPGTTGSIRINSLNKATVLVVEDDLDTLELLESTLQLAGAKAISARSVREALKVIDGHRIDALVSDIAMPGQDGYTLMTLLRDRLGPAMPDVSVALTAYAGRADRERAINAGFAEHLAKPLNPDVLLRTLEDLLAASAQKSR